MKIFIFTFFNILLALSAGTAQNESTDPHAVFPPHDMVINTGESFLDELLFTNINLTVQTAPQNEPTVRISRVNPNIIVAAWRDFRLGYINPIVRRIGYSYSSNGGLTWAASQLLPDPNPNHVSQSDPVLTSDAQGNFYISSTSRKQNIFPENRDQIVYKSTNNGQTFVFYSVGIAGTGGGGEDKEWMFCDPVSGNPTFNNLFMTSTNTNNGIIRFAKSTNGGLNWTVPVNVSNTAGGTGSNICSGTSGQIYVVWDQSGIRFDRSTDGGATFGADYQLSTVSSTNGFPFICVDYSSRPTRGNVYVVWDDSRNGNSDVWFQRSTNGGLNWLTTPVRINDVTTNSQLWPAIQCDTNGYLSVVYYDNRTGTNYNSYFAYSINAGDTWANQLLSDSSFTRTAVGSDVRYGDYIGIDAFSNKIFPVWTDDRKGTPNQEIYTASVNIVVSAENNNRNIPKEFSLEQNYPNPFNPSTSIKFGLPSAAFVTLKVYDILGREVAAIVSEQLEAGNYEVTWDAEGFTSGVYFYRLTSGKFTALKKMILLK